MILAMDRDIFWATFIVPFMDSLNFIRDLAAKVTAASGDGTVKVSEPEVASATKFGPYGLHAIADGLAFAWEFLQTVSAGIWLEQRGRFRDISSDLCVLINNFYHAANGISIETYTPIVFRQFIKAIEQCDKRADLTVRIIWYIMVNVLLTIHSLCALVGSRRRLGPTPCIFHQRAILC